MKRKFSLWTIISASTAIIFGAIVLATYLFPAGGLRNSILNWVVIATATALLVGVLNLLRIHLSKIRQQSGKSLYSFSVIVSLVLVFLVTLFNGSSGSATQWFFEYVQVPIESSLMAVLTVILTYSAARMLGRRTNLYSILFIAFTIIALIGNGSFIDIEFPFLQAIAEGGARGILLGVGLGTVTTGLRILMGVDRPYGS
ncbi:MAG: hypothetical protein N2D54_11010 [Chloroflexota bacterium]